MKRSLVLTVFLAAAVAATSSIAVTASAAGRNASRSGGHAAAPAAPAPAAAAKKHGKFPIPAADFKNASNERLAKAREKMEAHLKTKKVPTEKAQLIRARFDDVATKVNAAVAKVTADGSVTKDEVKEVRQAADKARKEGRATAHAHKKPESKDSKKGSAKDASKDAPVKDASVKDAPKAKKDDTQEAP